MGLTQANLATLVGDLAQRDEQVGWIAVVKTGASEPVIATGGYSDWKEKIPVQKDTLFKIGSITKLFTAASLLKLVEQKKVDLTDAIDVYLSGLPVGLKDIQLESLLNHTAGLPDYLDDPERADLFLYQDVDRARIFERILTYTPGNSSCFGYSNTHYFLLGKILEAVSLKSFEDFIAASFGKTLRLNSMRFNCKEGEFGLSKEYIKHPEGSGVNPPFPDKRLSLHNGYAAGNICCDVSDLTTFIAAFFSGQAVSQDLLAQAMTTLPPGPSLNSQYGYGLWRHDWGSVTAFGHAGNTYGHTSAAFYLPEKKTTVVLLSNTYWKPQHLDVVKEIAIRC